MPPAQTAADIVLKIKKNFRPNLSINNMDIKLAGNAADSEISDSINTELDMLDEQFPV